MPLPNPEVPIGFFESYIKFRKDTWHLDVNKPMLTSDPIGIKKLTTCGFLVQELLKAQTEADWKNVIAIFDKEERLEADKNASEWFHAVQKKIFRKTYYLWETLHACNTYLKLKLSNDGSLESTSDTQDAPEKYFQKVILPYDPKATELEEKNLSDFEDNIKKGFRPSFYCFKVLEQLTIKEASNMQPDSEIKTTEQNENVTQKTEIIYAKKANNNSAPSMLISQSKFAPSKKTKPDSGNKPTQHSRYDLRPRRQ